MNEFTPSNENLRYAWREVRPDRSLDEADAEFERWLAAHDQGVRDAVRPAEMTAREHLEAAFEAAFPVPEGRMIQRNTGYLSWRNGECVGVYSKGVSYETPGRDGDLERRTLDPLPPSIPDDCKAVWANWDEDGGRYVWNRHPNARDDWHTISAAGELIRARESNLIDPKPVPEEES